MDRDANVRLKKSELAFVNFQRQPFKNYVFVRYRDGKLLDDALRMKSGHWPRRREGNLRRIRANQKISRSKSRGRSKSASKGRGRSKSRGRSTSTSKSRGGRSKSRGRSTTRTRQTKKKNTNRINSRSRSRSVGRARGRSPGRPRRSPQPLSLIDMNYREPDSE